MLVTPDILALNMKAANFQKKMVFAPRRHYWKRQALSSNYFFIRFFVRARVLKPWAFSFMQTFQEKPPLFETESESPRLHDGGYSLLPIFHSSVFLKYQRGPSYKLLPEAHYLFSSVPVWVTRIDRQPHRMHSLH